MSDWKNNKDELPELTCTGNGWQKKCKSVDVLVENSKGDLGVAYFQGIDESEDYDGGFQEMWQLKIQSIANYDTDICIEDIVRWKYIK
jgi:hypothetical protein